MCVCVCVCVCSSVAVTVRVCDDRRYVRTVPRSDDLTRSASIDGLTMWPLSRRSLRISTCVKGASLWRNVEADLTLTCSSSCSSLPHSSNTQSAMAQSSTIAAISNLPNQWTERSDELSRRQHPVAEHAGKHCHVHVGHDCYASLANRCNEPDALVAVVYDRKHVGGPSNALLQ